MICLALLCCLRNVYIDPRILKRLIRYCRHRIISFAHRINKNSESIAESIKSQISPLNYNLQLHFSKEPFSAKKNMTNHLSERVRLIA